MADTPDLGAAQEAFTTAETGFKEIETSYNDAKAAWEADQENEDLKTAFTELEPKYNESKTSYDTARNSYFDALKANVRTGYWPEDWRENYVNAQKDKDGKPLDDAAKEKLTKRLTRYASPQAALDAMINAQNKISAGGMIKIPGENATPEEISEYRKAMGIPEEAKGYDLTLPDGLVIGDEDKDGINAFLEFAHNTNYTQAQVSAGLQWYFKTKEAEAARLFEADEKYHADAEDILRQEWGAEFRANQNLLANYIDTDFEEGIGALLVGARLADGTPLANHPGILRGLLAKARKDNPMGALVPGSGTKQHETLLDEIASLEKRMRDDRDAWYKDDKAQKRLMQLYEMRDKVKK